MRVLYLLLTNEPSNHKEWAREERREGMKRGEERKRVRGEEVQGSEKKMVERTEQLNGEWIRNGIKSRDKKIKFG